MKIRPSNTMKPILFNAEMVRATLDNRKTVTRRVVKPQHLRVLDSPYHKEHPETPDKVLLERLCRPPYLLGDLLYVRETWCQPAAHTFWYKADSTVQNIKWRPSIHMPREAARIFLRVTDVRVQRLQRICERGRRSAHNEGFINDIRLAEGTGKSATKHFSEFWDSTIKPKDRDLYGWAANPWVWVIEFERCEKPEDAQNEID